MQCLYCGKPLNLLRELADSEFCSRDHQQHYKRLTARAFSRLLETQPAPAPRQPPQHPHFRQLPSLEPIAITPSRRVGAGAWVASTADLAPPEIATAMPPLAPGVAGHVPADGPVPARRVAIALAETQAVTFGGASVSRLLRGLQLRTADDPAGALDAVLSHSPCLALRAVGPSLRESQEAQRPANEVLAQSSRPEIRLSSALATADPGSLLGRAAFRSSAPAALPMAPKMAGAPSPLVPMTRLGVPAPPVVSVFSPGPAGLLALPEPDAVSGTPMAMAAGEPLPCYHAPVARRLKLATVPDSLVLSVKGSVTEEVSAADVLDLPVSGVATPGAVSVAVPPVFASSTIAIPRPAGLLPVRMPDSVSDGSMRMAAREPLLRLHAPVMRRLKLAAVPDSPSLRAKGAVAGEVSGADILARPVNGAATQGAVPVSVLPVFASISVSFADAAGLLRLRMPGAVSAGLRMMPANEAVPCLPTPVVRRLKLNAAPDCLALRVEGAVSEEVFGADVADRPAGLPVTPSLVSGSVLPALASLFRYGRLARPAAPLPHMTEGVNPRNRLALPAAYMELPMPVQQPSVPRTSGLRIVETFEYLKPMEAPPFDLLQSLVQVWRRAPVYLRYAAVSACLILLFWAYIPRSGVAQMVASRWGRIEEGIGQRAAVELSEDFQGGMETWEGTGNWPRTWQISKAGYVRPGRLALYQPSMRMREYQVEFLMQVEKKAVSWAYRAADPENYYASKITIVKPGPLPVLSLIRYPVIGGRAGPKVEIPIRVLMHNNTPYRVQLTVSSGGFSTAIEGQLVDFWRDESLKVGGFGFFSDTGESARVYWMRLNHQNDFIGRVCAYFDPAPVDRRRTYRPQ